MEEKRKWRNALKVDATRVFTADFETSSVPNYEKDGKVHVWLWSLVNIRTKKSYHGTDIESFLTHIHKLRVLYCYFHNLKFDGSFLSDYLTRNNLEHTMLINNGVWYNLTYQECEFRDSLKKFKMSVNGLAYDQGITAKKDVRDDSGKFPWDYYIPLDYQPTLKEIEYCIHDSMIVANAIEKEWDNGRRKLTTSSEAFEFCKKELGSMFNTYYPTLSAEDDEFARDAYKGGFCYLNPKYAGVDLQNIYAYDINGLYGWVMDECRLPINDPYEGKPVNANDLYIVHFTCEFAVKEGMLPIVQVKKGVAYAGIGNEYLTESLGPTRLAMTCIDYEMFLEHYDVRNDFGYTYMSYKSVYGVLSPIIRKNLEDKEYYSKKATYDSYRRGVAKDNTNMLYGSFGRSRITDTVTPYIDKNNELAFTHEEGEKDGRYAALAVFVTAYARQKTIKAIQANYDNWIYSDTDSMYLTAPAVGIEFHHEKSGAWDFETWEDSDKPFPFGKFLRQKTYCLVDENKVIYKKRNKYGILVTECKCAGMPDSVKETVTWDDMVLGKEFEGMRKQHTVVPGGICLIERSFTIKGRIDR